MTDVIARIKLKGKNFEIMVDCDKAVNFKKSGKKDASMIQDALAIDVVYNDYKKGFKASLNDLKDAFKTEDVYEIAAKIVSDGEIQLTQEYRDKEREIKLKQIITFLAKNCVDPRTNAPYTAERIASAIKQAGVKINENQNAEEQALQIIRSLETTIPLKIDTKKIKLIVPASYTGQIYNLLKNFKKEKEEWLSDGSLSCIINLPAGMQLEFYDKLNGMTHGSAITEELK